jgi:hypothetical protein
MVAAGRRRINIEMIRISLKTLVFTSFPLYVFVPISVVR